MLKIRPFCAEDKEKILTLLLANGDRVAIDDYIKKFRNFNTGGVAAAGTQISNEQNEVEDFLGKSWYSMMKTELDDIAADTLKDLKELDKEDIDMLAAKLKK